MIDLAWAGLAGLGPTSRLKPEGASPTIPRASRVDGAGGHVRGPGRRGGRWQALSCHSRWPPMMSVARARPRVSRAAAARLEV